MTKTPDEINKGLYSSEETKQILQTRRGIIHSQDKLYRSALALIQQLEAENKQYHQENTEMYAEMCMLREKVHRLEAERDALMNDIRMEGSLCALCEHCDVAASEEPCKDCNVLLIANESKWQWRGVQKEG